MLILIGTTVELIVKESIETTYDWVVDGDAPIKFINTHGPVPRFKSYVLLDGDWKHEGARRQVTLDDSSQVQESIKTIKRPDYFDYELKDFQNMSPVLKALLKSAYGQFWFESLKTGGTHVRWRYSFVPGNVLLVPLVWLFTNIIYRSFMKAALKKMKQFSDEENLKLA